MYNAKLEEQFKKSICNPRHQPHPIDPNDVWNINRPQSLEQLKEYFFLGHQKYWGIELKNKELMRSRVYQATEDSKQEGMLTL